MVKYLEYIGSLNNNDVPDYDYCKKLLNNKLASLKCSSPYGKLIFGYNNNTEVSSRTQKKAKLSPKVRAGRKKVNSVVESIDSSPEITKKTTRNVRKRKSPDAAGSSHDNEVTEEALLKNKKSRKAIVKSKPVLSNGSAKHESEVNDDSVNVSANSGAENSDSDDDDDDGKTSKRGRRLSRRSSIKFTVRKKSPKIKGVSKKLRRASDKLLLKKIVNGLNPAESESSSVSSLVSDKTDIKAVKVSKTRKNETKPSWKDAPTVIASNIIKAGEYTKVSSSSGSKVSKKKK